MHFSLNSTFLTGQEKIIIIKLKKVSLGESLPSENNGMIITFLLLFQIPVANAASASVVLDCVPRDAHLDAVHEVLLGFSLIELLLFGNP